MRRKEPLYYEKRACQMQVFIINVKNSMLAFYLIILQYIKMLSLHDLENQEFVIYMPSLSFFFPEVTLKL